MAIGLSQAKLPTLTSVVVQISKSQTYDTLIIPYSSSTALVMHSNAQKHTKHDISVDITLGSEHTKSLQLSLSLEDIRYICYDTDVCYIWHKLFSTLVKLASIS